jgi:hypothetical protein
MANPGDETIITPRDAGKTFERETGYRHVFRIRRFLVRWIEIEDVLFHFDSAVMMPDAESEEEPGTPDQDRITGLSVMRAAYLQAGDHPEQKLLLAGHSDTSGDATYNEKLSRWRAEDVLHVLLGEKDAWVTLAKDHHQAGDIKHILRWVARWKGWLCHTDSTDDTMDTVTKDGVKVFQSEFSKHVDGYSIAIDGAVGKETWGAFFHLYMLRLAELCNTDVAGLATLRGKLKWLYGDHKSIGCGEYHPIDMPGKNNVKSQKNRRVELLFYDPGEEPLQKPAGALCHGGGVGGVANCPIYNPKIYRYEHLVPKQLHILKVDDHFAPGAETLDIKYQIEGLGAGEVTLEISSPHYGKNPIFKRPLQVEEKADGPHTIAWDGKANCAEGDLKDACVHPLYSPYTVRLSDGATHTDQATFKVLYHSVALRQGPWTADEAAPPTSDEKAWTQFKLNELGYYGGPVGKDSDSYLDRAVIRYKANHKAMHQIDYAKYDASISTELKAALTKGENKRIFFDGQALTDPTQSSRLLVEALTYESKPEFGVNKTSKEKVRLNRPLLPLEVDIFLKSKADAKTWAPAGVGPVRVNWRFTDPDEDLSVQVASTPTEPSKTAAYLEKSLKLHDGRNGNKGDNCHKDFDGIRQSPNDDWFAPAFLGDAYVPYKVEKDNGQKVIFSKACVDSAKFAKRMGRAGFLFRPSYIAGDDYRIKAEIDFTGLANQAVLESFHGVTNEATRIGVESGTIRIWRAARVALQVTWPPRTNSHEWAEIAAEFNKAYLDVDVGGIVTKKMRDVMTESQYKKIVSENTSHKKSDVKLLDDALVGVKLPKQGSMNAADYKDALKTFTSDEYWKKIVYVLREQLSANIRKDFPTGFVVIEFLTHQPVTLLKAPPGDKTVLDASYVTWSFSIGLPDSTIFADQRDPDKVYYVVSHEMGHNFWLKHWEHAGGSRPQDHDKVDHNCSMSYSSSSCAHAHHRPGSYTPHFCGKCNLKLRGWDIDQPGIPADST